MLVGDMNLPGIDWTRNRVKKECNNKHIHQQYLHIMDSHNMEQHVTEPTHERGNTLDLVCSNDIGLIQKVAVIMPGLSDHYLVNIEITHKMPVSIEKTKKIRRLYHKADLQAFREQMEELSAKLSDNIKDPDPEEMWNVLLTGTQEAIEKNVPTKTVSDRPKNEPVWFNKSAKNATMKHRRTYNLYKRTGDPFLKCRYIKERREAKKLLRAIKNDYITRVVTAPLEEGQTKPFYSYLRKTTQRSADTIEAIEDDQGNRVEDRETCANILNSFFQKQFQSSNQLVPMVAEYRDTCKLTVTEEGIRKLLTGMKKGKAPGPDGLRKEDLCLDVDIMAECLTKVFNASLQKGQVPKDWRLANVVPIHKKGSRKQAGNYRPISLTSLPCKLLEHIVLREIIEKVETALSTRQHGFRCGLSCETQLCGTYHTLAKNTEAQLATHAVVLDYSKAFDRVPHQLLLEKLQLFDLEPHLIGWIHSFLCGRTQRVALGGAYSHEIEVTSGVPQGSVLGPTLFLLYINDLPIELNCGVSLFADDTLIYQTVRDGIEENRFQENIDRLKEWSDRWMMNFNTAKCSVILFNEKQGRGTSYKLGGQILGVESEVKYLGVTIQDDLKFRKHITDKISKASQALGMIKRCLYGAPKKAKMLAYTSLCRPHLEYASAVWDPTKRMDVESIERVQSKAVRFIGNVHGRESVTKAREELELKTLEERRATHRFSLVMRVMRDDTNHHALSEAYDELMNSGSGIEDTVTTRSKARGEPSTIYAANAIYYNSFLPRAVRELKVRCGIE